MCTDIFKISSGRTKKVKTSVFSIIVKIFKFNKTTKIIRLDSTTKWQVKKKWKTQGTQSSVKLVSNVPHYGYVIWIQRWIILLYSKKNSSYIVLWGNVIY